jgi:hypothetical protein
MRALGAGGLHLRSRTGRDVPEGKKETSKNTQIH